MSKIHHEPAYIVGVSAASWHCQERETWQLRDNPTQPDEPYVSSSSISCSGLTQGEARQLVRVGCVCYDLSEEGLDGAVAACSLPTRGFGKDQDYAVEIWKALLGLKEKFPMMKLGIATKDKEFPWEGRD
jgi:hypothetical protein